MQADGQQQWNPLGPDDFDQLSYGIADYVSAAKGPGQSLYVAFQDQSSGSKAVAWKYVNGIWTKLGTEAISAGVARYTDIAVSSLGVPYVVYEDYAAGYKATVKKFNGSNWVAVGEEGFSVASVEYTRIAMAPDNTPYVVYLDYSEGSKATVKKFDGNSWTTVGAAGISVSSILWGTDIAVGSDGIPFIVYTDFGLGLKATAKKFNGTAWVDAGNPGFSNGNAGNCQIALSGTNVPYVVYNDHAAGNKATVKRLSGSIWVNVGPAGFSDAAIGSPTISIAPNNDVFVGYSETNGIAVKKYTGGQWVTAGSEDFVYVTSGDYGLSLVAVGNDSLCLAFTNWKANVACYDGNTWKVTKETGITQYRAQYPELTISNFIIPYLTFPHFYITYMPVLSYHAPSWTYLPPLPDIGFDLHYPTIEAAPDGSLYAAYVDEIVYNDSSRIRVNHYDGSGWAPLSENGLGYGKSFDLFDFAVDKTGIPYVVYDIVNTAQFAVSRFNGSAWELAGDVFPVNASDFEIAFSANNTPFIAYRDMNAGITVKKLNGVNWETVGTENFVTSVGDPYVCAKCVHFAVAGDSTPYLLYTSETSVIRLIQYDDGQWRQIGDSLHVEGSNQVALAVAGNTPYVLYEDLTENRGVVRKWDGHTWTLLGGMPFSAGKITALSSYPDLFVTGDRTVFVAYDNYTLYAKSYEDECTAPANIEGPDTVSLGQAVAFSAPAGFTGYTWNAGTGVVSGGQGTAHVQIGFPASGNAVVSVTVTDSDGCAGTATRSVYVPGSIGTYAPLPVSVRITPNPFGDVLRLEVRRSTGSIRHLRISDAVGRMRWERMDIPEGEYRIETSTWPSGIYLLQVEEAGGAAVWRVVKI